MSDARAHHLGTSHNLLERLRQPSRDEISWQRFLALYRPWLDGWFRRRVTPHVAEDLLQEVLAVVCRRLPAFEHNQRPGAFRAWLKEILKNCLRDFQKKRHPVATGDRTFLEVLEQLEDPKSGLQRQWDLEHDQHILHRLLEMARQQFSAQDYEAFCRVKLRGESALQVATTFGIPSLAAVYKKVSRVLDWLQQEGRGLLDESSL